jgi:hypothetical protein
VTKVGTKIEGAMKGSEVRNDIGAGKLEVPKNWELRVQHTYVEPAATLKAPLAMQNTQAKPRANVVVSRVPASAERPEAAANDFFAQTAQTVPGLRRLSQETFAFDDGAMGTSLTVAFHATPQLRLVQRHVFRIDADVLTQLVATVDEARASELDENMAAILKSFKP